jgi:hypothetical protein
LLAILGSDWRIAARTPYPRLRGANNLVVPENKIPKEEVKAEEPEDGEEDEEDEKDDENKDDEDKDDDDDEKDDNNNDDDKDEDNGGDETPEQGVTSVTYVCFAPTADPNFAYYRYGPSTGGPLSQAARFTADSQDEANCKGKRAGGAKEESLTTSTSTFDSKTMETSTQTSTTTVAIADPKDTIPVFLD